MVRIRKRLILKSISKFITILGVICIGFGILYFLIPSNIVLYDIFGDILILNWILSITLVYLIDKSLNKSTEIGKKINRHSFYFLATFIISILLILFGIIFTTFILQGFLYILANIMTPSGFFLISIYIVYLSLLISKFINVEGAWNFE